MLCGICPRVSSLKGPCHATDEGSVGSRTTDAEGFADWLEPVTLRIVVSRDHGQWYATSDEFGLVGAGLSEDAAIKNLGRVLSAYLHDFYARGLSFDMALHASASPSPSARPSLTGAARFLRRQLASRLSPKRRRTLPLYSVLQ